MAFTPTSGYNLIRKIPMGKCFMNVYRKMTAGASGNTITLGCNRVLSVIASGNGTTDIAWSWSKPTLTLTVTNAKIYDVWVLYE